MKNPRTIRLEPMTKSAPVSPLQEIAILAPVAIFLMAALFAAIYVMTDQWGRYVAASALVS